MLKKEYEFPVFEIAQIHYGDIFAVSLTGDPDMIDSDDIV